MTRKATEKKKTAVCKKCGKPGATHWVTTGEHTMAGPYHEGCKPK
jgi:hypothetical protein